MSKTSLGGGIAVFKKKADRADKGKLRGLVAVSYKILKRKVDIKHSIFLRIKFKLRAHH